MPPSWIEQGIVWAVDHGADVINISAGGPRAGASMDEAIAYANAHGVAVVAAAGNTATSDRFYPAASAGAISVGATSWSDARVPYSTFGSWVDLSAPGTTSSTYLNGEYSTDLDGTSFASPHVAGTVGLMLSLVPDATPA